MPKRRAHIISDSEDEDDFLSSIAAKVENETAASNRSESPKKKTSLQTIQNEDDDNEFAAMQIVPFEKDNDAGKSLISLECEEMNVQRTPQAFKTVEVATRAGRKERTRMISFVIDRSPSEYDNLETYVGYIVKRRLADAFMQMIFEKNCRPYCLVMTCCDSETNNLSNQERPKNINNHCVELVESGPIKPGKIRSLKEELEKKALQPESEQFSNVMCGIMTAADIINNIATRNKDEFCDIDLTVFSDLGFDTSDPTYQRMKKVLKQVFTTANMTIVSDKSSFERGTYQENVKFFEDIVPSVNTISYQEAMKKSEQWTMNELMPAKWNAAIQLFGEEIPTESYLICTGNNKPILKTYLEKETNECGEGEADGFSAAVSTIKQAKQLVKLTKEGHYKRDSEGSLITVAPERAVMAYKFGTTAVLSEKVLKGYMENQESYKGFVVKGWYPSHQFLLHLNGGNAYHVFSSGTEGKPKVFDTLLQLCADRGRSLLVEYASAVRFPSKSGVLIPHLKKHCFVFYELIYKDNMNYLPRYDPIATQKPKPEHLKEVAHLISKSGVASLEMKYDSINQQIFEDVWEGRLDEMSKRFVEKFTEFKKDTDESSRLPIEAAALAERAEGVVQRIATEEKPEIQEKDDVPYLVEALDEKSDEFQPANFSKLFH